MFKIPEFTNLELIIIIAFCFVFVVQLYYYLFFYLRIARYRIKDKKNEQFPVSIVICAKDEADNLESFLPEVLEQDYPDFEVIVVNDGSIDETSDVLKRLDNRYENLYVTTIPENTKLRQGKKLAITIGVKAAKNEWILFTDADCRPTSNKWISSMQSNFTEKNDLVLAYGGYMERKGVLNKLIRFDSLFIAMQYLSFALAGKPYMGVGRNLAYRKSVFFKSKGFASHLKIKSGDDDLFVNKIANKKNTGIEISPESFTQSVPEKKFSSWYYQKKRHLTTGKYYRTKHKVLLGAELLSRILFYILFAVGLNYNSLIFFFLTVFFVRLILQLVTYYYASVKFNEKKVFYLGIIFDFILPMINFIIILGNIRLRKRRNGFAV
jgi:glycosyltransferase involved in cell wall biosynthesis